MKIVIESTFHPGLTETFTGLREGPNWRNIKYRHDGCNCGWPVKNVNVHPPKGYVATVAWTPNDGEIRIGLMKKENES